MKATYTGDVYTIGVDMGLHEGAPKFVAPKWVRYGDDPDEARRKEATLRDAERHTARQVRDLCNEAIWCVANDVRNSSAREPLAGHFMAHRYTERIIQIADLHESGRCHALAWDARGLRWMIETLPPIGQVEAALLRLRDAAVEVEARAGE